jgi:hypothetical protein
VPGGGTEPYGLYDFFNFQQTALPPPNVTSWKYRPDCFHHPGDANCFSNYPADPDNDANESD